VQHLFIDALYFQAYLPTVEIGDNSGSGVGPEFRGQSGILKQCDDPLAERFAIVIGNNKGIMQMPHALRGAGKANRRFTRQHVIQKLDRMTWTVGAGDYGHMGERREPPLA
jgi:hypothetical protein